MCIFSLDWCTVDMLWCNAQATEAHRSFTGEKVTLCSSDTAALLIKQCSCVMPTGVIGIPCNHCKIFMWLSSQWFAALRVPWSSQLGLVGCHVVTSFKQMASSQWFVKNDASGYEQCVKLPPVISQISLLFDCGLRVRNHTTSGWNRPLLDVLLHFIFGKLGQHGDSLVSVVASQLNWGLDWLSALCFARVLYVFLWWLQVLMFRYSRFSPLSKRRHSVFPLFTHDAITRADNFLVLNWQWSPWMDLEVRRSHSLGGLAFNSQ